MVKIPFPSLLSAVVALASAPAWAGEVPVADVKGTFTPAAMPGFDVIRVGIGGSLMPAGTTSGNVQQFGSKSAVPPPGQVNPSVTQPVGSWK